MKKFLSSLFIIVLALLVFVVVAKDWIIKTSIEQGVTLATGFKTHVKSVRFSLPSTVEIKGLNIRNPEGFKEKNFVDIPEIFVSVALDEVLKGTKLHLPEVRLNIQEIRIEKNEKGVSNIELLSSVGGQKSQPQAPSKTSEPAKPAMPFQLDKLMLTIRNVSYEDNSGGASALAIPGKRLSADLNLQNEIMTDVTDPKALVNLILAKVLNSATLGKLLNIDPTALMKGSLDGVQQQGQQLLNQSTQALNQQLNTVTSQVTGGAATDTVKKASDLLGSAASSTTGQVSGLLGKLKSAAVSDDSKQS